MTPAAGDPRRPSRPRERLIDALLPAAAEWRPAAVRLPMLPTPCLPAAAGPELLIECARIDHAGRVHARAVFDALGWEPGRRLALDTVGELIVIAPDPAGWHRIGSRGAVTLPAAARRMCGIDPGPPLVLAAAVAEQLLVVHPAATVARLLAGHYRELTGARP